MYKLVHYYFSILNLRCLISIIFNTITVAPPGFQLAGQTNKQKSLTLQSCTVKNLQNVRMLYLLHAYQCTGKLVPVLRFHQLIVQPVILVIGISKCNQYEANHSRTVHTY